MAKLMQKLCELRRSHTDVNTTCKPASPRMGGAICDRRLRLRITITPADGEGRPKNDCQCWIAMWRTIKWMLGEEEEEEEERGELNRGFVLACGR